MFTLKHQILNYLSPIFILNPWKGKKFQIEKNVFLSYDINKKRLLDNPMSTIYIRYIYLHIHTYIYNYVMLFIYLLLRNKTIYKDYLDTKALHLKWFISKEKQTLPTLLPEAINEQR